MEAPVIEVAIFSPKPGVTDEALVAAAAKSTAFLERTPGFVRRELGVSSEGDRWVDVLHWTDLESALGAADLFLEAPECQDFVAAIDMEGASMLHLHSRYVRERA